MVSKLNMSRSVLIPEERPPVAPFQRVCFSVMASWHGFKGFMYSVFFLDGIFLNTDVPPLHVAPSAASTLPASPPRLIPDAPHPHPLTLCVPIVKKAMCCLPSGQADSHLLTFVSAVSPTPSGTSFYAPLQIPLQSLSSHFIARLKSTTL